MKKLITIVFASLVGALIGIGLFKILDKEKTVINYSVPHPVHFTSFGNDNVPIDFTFAAGLTTPAVVHVKTTYAARRVPVSPFYFPDPFRELFGGNQEPYYRNVPKSQAFGSGVIISDNGYVVTNNHVVNDGDEIEITMSNRRTYKAVVIGTDPSTDLALLKVEAKNLPFIVFSNSDSVKVGEWVLAVGNPFNLTSTVTAGIVSAKARNIGILENKDSSTFPIESFIQTDAAVNRGNSGGALVNMRGELIGITSAIESPTGSYAGYAFAIPVNIVKKTIEDLIKYGSVQRGFLGVQISNIDEAKAKELGMESISGIYVNGVNTGSGAEEAGIKPQDVIVKINGTIVNESAELLEMVSRYHPGDKINVTVIRKGKENNFSVTLKNKSNTTAIVQKPKIEPITTLGAEFQELSDSEKNRYGIDGGVKVGKMKDGKLLLGGVKEGFIITAIDNKPVNSIEDIQKILETKKGGVLFEGFYSNSPAKYFYGIGI